MSFLGSLFGRRTRRPLGWQSQGGALPAQTILRGSAAPDEPMAVVKPAPEPTSEASSEAAVEAAPEQVEAGPRVGLFFGDGSHVVMEADDPWAGAFAAIADELNH